MIWGINSTVKTNKDIIPDLGSNNYISLDLKQGESIIAWIKPSINNEDGFMPASGPYSFGPDLSSELK